VSFGKMLIKERTLLTTEKKQIKRQKKVWSFELNNSEKILKSSVGASLGIDVWKWAGASKSN